MEADPCFWQEHPPGHSPCRQVKRALCLKLLALQDMIKDHASAISAHNLPRRQPIRTRYTLQRKLGFSIDHPTIFQKNFTPGQAFLQPVLVVRRVEKDQVETFLFAGGQVAKKLR